MPAGLSRHCLLPVKIHLFPIRIRTKVKAALDKVEFLIVSELFLTETAAMADVVLPACSFAEKEGTFTSTDRRVQYIKPAISKNWSESI